jgi:hypothetical protein
MKAVAAVERNDRRAEFPVVRVEWSESIDDEQ